MNREFKVSAMLLMVALLMSCKPLKTVDSNNKDRSKNSEVHIYCDEGNDLFLLLKAVGIGLSVFGQFTGVNIVIYYGPTILEGAGYELDSAIQFQVLIGLINLVFTIIALFKIDSWGRRPLLIGLLFFYYFVPETKGMSLEEIEEYWKNERV